MAFLKQRIARLVAVLLAARVAICPSCVLAYTSGLGAGLRYRSDCRWDTTRGYAYSCDGAGNVVRAGRTDAAGQGRAVFEADALNFHAVRRWNAVDLVGVAREDAQVLVNGKAVLRDGRRFVYSLPLAEGSSAHVTNLTLLARVSEEDEEWVAQQNVILRVPACPESIDVALAGATVGDSLAEYLFDARNRLRRVTDKIGAPRLRAVYDYYPDGRRARKIVSVWTNEQWQAACTNQFLYDRWNLVREVVTDGGATTTRDYTWGLDIDGLQGGVWGQDAGGIGGLLAITEVSGTSTNIFLPVSDHVGTIHSLVAAMTNSVALSQPCVVETRTYSPYGDLIEVDCSLPTVNCQLPTALCPFGFQSKYYDPETGFWNFGYRLYDAKACKWLTADPLGEDGGLNLTAFCGGDPVNQVDPLGLEIGVVPPGQAWQAWFVQYEGAGPYYYGTELWEAPIAGLANVGTFAANTFLGAGNALHALLEVNINDPGAEWSAVFPAAPIASIATAEQGVGMMAARAWGTIAATRAGDRVASLASSAREWSARSIGRVFGKNAPVTGNPAHIRPQTGTSVAPKSTALTIYEPWPKAPSSPHADGFLFGARQVEMAQPGQIFSRLGETSGRYVSLPGTSLSARGLPARYQGSETLWQVVKPFEIESGLAAPWQGSSGMGIQNKLPQSIQSLWDSGYLSPAP